MVLRHVAKKRWSKIKIRSLNWFLEEKIKTNLLIAYIPLSTNCVSKTTKYITKNLILSWSSSLSKPRVFGEAAIWDDYACVWFNSGIDNGGRFDDMRVGFLRMQVEGFGFWRLCGEREEYVRVCFCCRRWR